jgi:beta-galactosidase
MNEQKRAILACVKRPGFILIFLTTIFFAFSNNLMSQPETGRVIDLNGDWDFEQTVEAFPPGKFTRKCPVPGLIHLAEPKIEDYDKFFKKPDNVELKESHNLYNINYTPRYSWYRKKLIIPSDLAGKEAVITIKKSQYVTEVYINGWDAGGSMACYTPIDLNITSALKFGEQNEILIRVGDRMWLPGEAAGSTDKEKEHYLPGIWDDVFLTFTGKIRTSRVLLLPSLEDKLLTAKIDLQNFHPAQIHYGDPMEDTVSIYIDVIEKESGKIVGSEIKTATCIRDNITEVILDIPIPDPHPWSPDDPFLYTARIKIFEKDRFSDSGMDQFGMRDFERWGKYFYLNGKKTFLRGTNITLHRFFEDPNCGDLAWDREWVKKLLIDYSKELKWNTMRICVGIVPDFWYDIADEYGLMFQNEWLYWQDHGWNEQIRKEYTDWVKSDGSHPSIVIWDALNENWNEFIGNELIPELMELDPTRIWDAGYMTASDMGLDEMDEPHPYDGPMPWRDMVAFMNYPYPLGNLDYRNAANIKSLESGTAQLVNEYGWVWLWRDGRPSKLTIDFYKYYLGEQLSAESNRRFQAYWLQLETEWLRSIREHAGVLAFTHLTNNYGYTGDWFIDHIKDLEPSPVLKWFKHAFSPVAVFINLTDERYVKFTEAHKPGSNLIFSLVGINDFEQSENGQVQLALYDEKGVEILYDKQQIELSPTIRTIIPVSIKLPEKAGGYLLVATFTPGNTYGEKTISRRYIKIGNLDNYKFWDIKL